MIDMQEILFCAMLIIPIVGLIYTIVFPKSEDGSTEEIVALTVFVGFVAALAMIILTTVLKG